MVVGTKQHSKMDVDDLTASKYLGNGRLHLNYSSGSFLANILPVNGVGDVPISAGFCMGDETLLSSFYTQSYSNVLAQLITSCKCAVCSMSMCAI